MKRLILFLVAALFGVAAAAEYPAKPIRIIIPFGPGSGTDAAMRVIVPPLSQALGQPVVIDPRPGANGAIAVSEVARSAPDGYTLGIGTGGPLAAVPALRKNPPYDPVRDFTPISDMGRYTVFMLINSAVPAASFHEFVDYVRANPGKVSYGTGSPSAMVAWAQINSLLNLNMLNVQYKSGPEMLPDLLSGRIDATIESPVFTVSHVNEGKLRALVTTLSTRSSVLPDVPTIHEAGVPQFTITNWMGLIGPSGLPANIVERLNREIGAALRRPEVISALEKQGFIPSPSSPNQFASLIEEQMKSYETLLRKAGVGRD